MTWKNIIKEEEDLPEDVKRARERVRQGLPSREQPLIPQFDDAKKALSKEAFDEINPTLMIVGEFLTKNKEQVSVSTINLFSEFVSSLEDDMKEKTGTSLFDRARQANRENPRMGSGRR